MQLRAKVRCNVSPWCRLPANTRNTIRPGGVTETTMSCQDVIESFQGRKKPTLDMFPCVSMVSLFAPSKSWLIQCSKSKALKNQSKRLETSVYIQALPGQLRTLRRFLKDCPATKNSTGRQKMAVAKRRELLLLWVLELAVVCF